MEYRRGIAAGALAATVYVAGMAALAVTSNTAVCMMAPEVPVTVTV